MFFSAARTARRARPKGARTARAIRFNRHPPILLAVVLRPRLEAVCQDGRRPDLQSARGLLVPANQKTAEDDDDEDEKDTNIQIPFTSCLTQSGAA
jgi:hypothetical protein